MGPVVQSSSLFHPKSSLLSAEPRQAPHWFSKFVVMLSFINQAKVKVFFCSGTGKVLLGYWLRAKIVLAWVEKGGETAICGACSGIWTHFHGNAQLRFLLS